MPTDVDGEFVGGLIAIRLKVFGVALAPAIAAIGVPIGLVLIEARFVLAGFRVHLRLAGFASAHPTRAIIRIIRRMEIAGVLICIFIERIIARDLPALSRLGVIHCRIESRTRRRVTRIRSAKRIKVIDQFRRIRTGFDVGVIDWFSRCGHRSKSRRRCRRRRTRSSYRRARLRALVAVP
ncbi:MAG: hypothetical protein WBO12_25115 [Xanthobacteraceae bacterium]|jgi:hypothetical protein